MAPSATAGHTKRDGMTQQRRTAPPARSAARTAKNPATEVPRQDTASQRQTTTGRDSAWWAEAVAAVELLASVGDTFVADSVRELGVPEPTRPQRWATLFRTMHARGSIHCIGTTLALRPNGNLTPTRLWRGTRRTQRGVGDL